MSKFRHITSNFRYYAIRISLSICQCLVCLSGCILCRFFTYAVSVSLSICQCLVCFGSSVRSCFRNCYFFSFVCFSYCDRFRLCKDASFCIIDCINRRFVICYRFGIGLHCTVCQVVNLTICVVFCCLQVGCVRCLQVANCSGVFTNCIRQFTLICRFKIIAFDCIYVSSQTFFNTFRTCFFRTDCFGQFSLISRFQVVRFNHVYFTTQHFYILVSSLQLTYVYCISRFSTCCNVGNLSFTISFTYAHSIVPISYGISTKRYAIFTCYTSTEPHRNPLRSCCFCFSTDSNTLSSTINFCLLP